MKLPTGERLARPFTNRVSLYRLTNYLICTCRSAQGSRSQSIDGDSGLSCSSIGSRASPSRRLRSCCAISACSPRCRFSRASRSSFFCGSSIAPRDRLATSSPLPLDDNPSQPIIASEAVPVDSSQRHVTSRLTQNNAEIAVALRATTS